MSIKEKKIKELVKEIMQTGFDVAMGGDAFKSEEENKKLQEKEYYKAIEKYTKAIQQTNNTTLDLAIEEIKKNKELPGLNKAIVYTILTNLKK